MEKTNLINCPNCNAEINVNEVLFKQFELQFSKEYRQKQSDLEKQFLEKESDLSEIQNILDKEKKELEEKNKDFAERVKSQVENKIAAEKLLLEQSFKEKNEKEKEEFKQSLIFENSQKMELLEKELKEKSEKLRDFNKMSAEIEILKREKEEIKEQVSSEKEKEFSKKLQEEREKVSQRVEDDFKLTLKERDKTIEDMHKQIEDLRKRAEQGSVQLQGEVQELEIEKTLKELFPFDEIIEVKKGVRGADITQIIKNSTGDLCGKIYYESKRTKNFDKNWISKLKEDNLQEKADILVIISEAMPDGQSKFFFKDGVWICSFREYPWLVPVLRYSVLEVHRVAITNEGRETRMEMLYNYLTGQEFRGQFEAMLDGFYSLKKNYEKEKMQIQKIWGERDAQLEKILNNSSYFYGKIKGIAESALPDIPFFEAIKDEKLLE